MAEGVTHDMGQLGSSETTCQITSKRWEGLGKSPPHASITTDRLKDLRYNLSHAKITCLRPSELGANKSHDGFAFERKVSDSATL